MVVAYEQMVDIIYSWPIFIYTGVFAKSRPWLDSHYHVACVGLCSYCKRRDNAEAPKCRNTSIHEKDNDFEVMPITGLCLLFYYFADVWPDDIYHMAHMAWPYNDTIGYCL